MASLKPRRLIVDDEVDDDDGSDHCSDPFADDFDPRTIPKSSAASARSKPSSSASSAKKAITLVDSDGDAETESKPIKKDAFTELMAPKVTKPTTTTNIRAIIRDDEDEDDTLRMTATRSSSDMIKTPSLKKRLNSHHVKYAMSTSRLRKALRRSREEDPLLKDIKFTKDSLKGIAELLTIFVSEATKRAKDEAEKEDDLSGKQLKPEHLAKILPKLLLDM